MGTKLERITEISASTRKPEFTSLYHHINSEMLKQCHKELDGNKAVGIDKVTKAEYEVNLEENITNLVKRLRDKSYKPLPSLRVFIPKGNGKTRPLGIASYEDKIVQLAVKKILEAIYEPRFQNNMYGFRPKRSCHDAIKEVYNRMYNGKINYIVDADIKGFFGGPG
jgi:RNA-directed DNA polymerase